jgi:hypothetical protein
LIASENAQKCWEKVSPKQIIDVWAKVQITGKHFLAALASHPVDNEIDKPKASPSESSEFIPEDE